MGKERCPSKCIACHKPIDNNEKAEICEAGSICQHCTEKITRTNRNISIQIIKHDSPDKEQRKWFRNIYIRDLRLYSTGSEILMIIGSLIEDFWKTEQAHGCADYTQVPYKLGPNELTPKEQIEQWLTWWHLWKNDGRCCDEVEEELYDKLPKILRIAWD